MREQGQLESRILALLAERRPAAAFATQLQAGVGGAGIEAALERLEAEGRVLTLAMPPPDPHLVGLDLRVVAAVPDGSVADAESAARAVWDSWLRGFLATHRCG